MKLGARRFCKGKKKKIMAKQQKKKKERFECKRKALPHIRSVFFGSFLFFFLSFFLSFLIFVCVFAFQKKTIRKQKFSKHIVWRQ